MGVAVGVAGRLWFGKSEKKFRMGGGWMDSQLEMWENGARKISWLSGMVVSKDKIITPVKSRA